MTLSHCLSHTHVHVGARTWSLSGMHACMRACTLTHTHSDARMLTLDCSSGRPVVRLRTFARPLVHLHGTLVHSHARPLVHFACTLAYLAANMLICSSGRDRSSRHAHTLARKSARTLARSGSSHTDTAVDDACTSYALTLMLVCSSAHGIRSHDRIYSLVRSSIRTASSSTCMLVHPSARTLARLAAYMLICSSARLLVAPYTYARTRVRSHARTLGPLTRSCSLGRRHMLARRMLARHACSPLGPQKDAERLEAGTRARRRRARERRRHARQREARTPEGACEL